MDLDLYKDMKIVMKKIADLKPAEYNPRKITNSELRKLENNIKSNGLKKPIVVNVNSKRKNIIISGHQTIKVLTKLEQVEVPCIEVNVSKSKEKELNIVLNRSNGEFDNSLLKTYFGIDELKGFGFKDSEVKILLPTFEDLETGEAIYPCIPKMSEKYSYILIVSKNEIDDTFLQNFFELQHEKSYKSSKIGVGRVISFEKFKELVDGNSKADNSKS